MKKKKYFFLNFRIRTDKSGGAWCPKKQIGPKVREWIEIDLGENYRITRTGTQGRYGQGRGQEYAEKFKLEYFRNGKWRTYRNHTKHEVSQSDDYDEVTYIPLSSLSKWILEGMC